MKKGFGIIEVLVAAVVLGFLIVGLNELQKGNRESVIRIRARDVAQNIAAEVIDSLRRAGLNTVETINDPLEKERIFKGAGVGDVPIKYYITVEVEEDEIYKSNEHTALTRATVSNPSVSDRLAYDFAKKLNVNVEWEFKKSTQSIQVSEVIK